MAKRKKPVEAVSGTYTAIPHAVLDSAAFVHAGHTARSLLFDLFRQHNGRNNGHLHLSGPWLKRRGWTSTDTYMRAKKELEKRGLIVLTRQGGLNFGPCHYALTWLPISNFVGLDITARDYHPGAWLFLGQIETTSKRATHTATRCTPAPLGGTEDTPATPSNGAETTVFQPATAPAHGNNECYQLPPAKPRIAVGLAGRSGKRASKTQPPTEGHR